MAVSGMDFYLRQFEGHKAKGLDAYRSERWEEARYNLLKAAEFLYKLARGSDGKIRDERMKNADRLLQMAKRIDPETAHKNKPKTGAQGGSGGARAEADGKAGDGAKFQAAERPSLRFSDVAGLEQVKEEIRVKMIYPFTHREHADRFRIRRGGGILLFGPPGTGKTMIARATAGEIDAAFFTVKPSEIMSKWVGDSEQNIAELFRTARQNERSIIFIDEIEALVPKREDSGSSVMQRVVPQILAELEGFDSEGKNPLLFLGATNEPWTLDPAVLRPGRFDEKIYLPLPDAPARRVILEIGLENRPIAPDVDVAALAERLDGYSGADLKNICEKAAADAFLLAVEKGVSDVMISCDTIERVLAEVKPSVSRKDLVRFEEYAKQR